MMIISSASASFLYQQRIKARVSSEGVLSPDLQFLIVYCLKATGCIVLVAPNLEVAAL